MAGFALFKAFLVASVFVSTCLVDARLSHRALSPNRHHQRAANSTATSPANLLDRRVPWGDDPQELAKRDGTKYVFMHHIVGNTYSYSRSDWEKDIREIQAKGVDALALNIGSSEWQRQRIADAYDVAQTIGTNFKLFISFDFTEMGCEVTDIVERTRVFANHPNQFKVNGKVFVSSYAGDCLRNDGWASLKAQTNAYIMPFIWGLEGQFGSWNSLDSWYCWGCAYPQGNYDKTTDDDRYYMSQLGSKYATTVSNWMFSNLPNKAFYQRGDNWLLNNRWEQLIAMRNELTFVEMLTWNDYGESNYFGAIRGAQPTGTYWADGFPHTAWYDMSEYYITAFKTGSYPAITKDVIYYWSKPHPALATASIDGGRRPDGYNWSLDYLWVAVFATSPAQVVLKSGGNSQSFNVNTGVSKLRVPSAEGRITVQMVRGGQMIIDQTPTDFNYVNNPTRYNYNAYVGAATASSSGPAASSTATSSTATSSSPSTTTSTTTTSTTTSATATTTSVSGSTWTYQGCYDDPTTNRVLYDGAYISDNSNSISKCLSTCVDQGYAFGGVEYGKECFCGTKIRDGAALKSNAECTGMPCAGNAAESCGNGNRLAVYSRPSTGTTGTTPAPTTTAVNGVTWTYRGCYPDNTNQRTIYDGTSSSDSGNTISKCLATCASSGYAFGGVEYGKECYCGNVIRSGVLVGSDSQCAMACSGNANEKCGDGNRIAIYSRSSTSTTTTTTTTTTSSTATATVAVTGFAPKGCVAEGTTGSRRALTGASFSRSDMTPQLCNSLCSAYQFAGAEYGTECYCGNSVTNNGATGATIASSNCASTCAGDASQICGGGWTMSLSQKADSVWNSNGCYIDTADRMLRGYLTSSSTMTTEKCLGTCLERGFKYAATQNGVQCFCGNEVITSGSLGSQTSVGECSTKCSGNSAQNCGAGWRNSLYTRAS